MTTEIFYGGGGGAGGGIGKRMKIVYVRVLFSPISLTKHSHTTGKAQGK